tara:strand:- start:37 stop:285 length:249 start_codon:yes stop_codon:yes gene_type:complete
MLKIGRNVQRGFWELKSATVLWLYLNIDSQKRESERDLRRKCDKTTHIYNTEIIYCVLGYAVEVGRSSNDSCISQPLPIRTQ